MIKIIDNLAYILTLFFQKIDHLGVELISGMWSVIIGVLTMIGYLKFNSIDFVYHSLHMCNANTIGYGKAIWGMLSILVGGIQIHAVFNQIRVMAKRKMNGTQFIIITITRHRVFAALLSGIYFGVSAVAYAHKCWDCGVWIGMSLVALADFFIFIRLSTIKKYV